MNFSEIENEKVDYINNELAKLSQMSDIDIVTWFSDVFEADSSSFIMVVFRYFMDYYRVAFDSLLKKEDASVTGNYSEDIDYKVAFGEEKYNNKEVCEDKIGLENFVFKFENWLKSTNKTFNSREEAAFYFLTELKNKSINGIKEVDQFFLAFYTNKSINDNKVREDYYDKIFVAILNYRYEEVKSNKAIDLLNGVFSKVNQDIENDLKFSELSLEERQLFLTDIRKFFVLFNRFENLQIKLIHTIRMLYITNLQLSMEEGVTSDVRDAVLMSILYHDIGRLYQAVNYPNFVDSNVLKIEDASDYVRDHAGIGYYYALGNLLIKDRVRSSNKIDKNFMFHALIGVPICFHQLPNNTDLYYYDVNYDISQLSLENAEEFIVNVFKNAPKMPKLEKKYASHKKSIEEINEKILKSLVKVIVNAGKCNAEDKKTLKKYVEDYYEDSSLLDEIINNPSLLADETYLEKLFSIFTVEQLAGFKEEFNKQFKESSNSIFVDVDSIFNALNKRMNSVIDVLNDKDFARYINDFFKFRYDLKNDIDKLFVLDKNNNYKDNSFIRSLVDKYGDKVLNGDYNKNDKFLCFIDLLIKILDEIKVFELESNQKRKTLTEEKKELESKINAVDSKSVKYEEINNRLKQIKDELDQIKSDKKQNLKRLCDKFNNSMNDEEKNEVMSFITKDMFNADDKVVDSCYKVVSACTLYTTDIDKVDILVQRANKNNSWEITNGIVFEPDVGKVINGPDDIISEQVRNNFYTGRQPLGLSSIGKTDGQKKIGVLWFHIEQFICTNMRNVNSFSSLKAMNLFEGLIENTVSIQKDEYKEYIRDLVTEVLAFGEMFIECVLNTRLDKDGNLVIPEFQKDSSGKPENWDFYVLSENENLSKPVILSSEQLMTIRKITTAKFLENWSFENNKPTTIKPSLKGSSALASVKSR